MLGQSPPFRLRLDLLNSPLVDSVWEVISNQEAIQVNQRWAGHPGWLLSWTQTAPKSNNWPNTPNGGVKYEAPLDAMRAWVNLSLEVPWPSWSSTPTPAVRKDSTLRSNFPTSALLTGERLQYDIWDHTNLGIAT